MLRELIILPERAESLFGFAALFYIAPYAVQGIFPGLLIASEPYIIFAPCFQFFKGICSFCSILLFHVFLEILAGAYLYLISGSPLVLCPLYR